MNEIQQSVPRRDRRQRLCRAGDGDPPV